MQWGGVQVLMLFEHILCRRLNIFLVVNFFFQSLRIATTRQTFPQTKTCKQNHPPYTTTLAYGTPCRHCSNVLGSRVGPLLSKSFIQKVAHSKRRSNSRSKKTCTSTGNRGCIYPDVLYRRRVCRSCWHQSCHDARVLFYCYSYVLFLFGDKCNICKELDKNTIIGE